MTTNITIDLLLASVGAVVGLFFGVSRFVRRQSGGLRGHRPRMKRHRSVKDATTYLPRPFDEVERDYELMKKEFRAREEYRRKEFAAREEHRRILRSAFDPDPCTIQVGDTVVFAFEDVPERHITVTLSRDMSDTNRGIIAMTHPIALAFLAGKDDAPARVGDKLEICAGGQHRRIIIVAVTKANSNN